MMLLTRRHSRNGDRTRLEVPFPHILKSLRAYTGLIKEDERQNLYI